MINGEWVPLAVALGIERDEFYSMNPKLMMRYMEFYKTRAKRKRDEMDNASWLTGLYMTRALGTMFKHKYPEQPFTFESNELDENGEKVTVEKKAADGFAAFAFVFNMERQKKLEREKKESEVVKDGKH